MNANSAKQMYQWIIPTSTNNLLNRIRQTLEETIMWTTPAATEMRFGFEVTMYVMNK